MLEIICAIGETPNPNSPGPLLSVQLRVYGNNKDVWLDVEGLNGSTRHHKNVKADQNHAEKRARVQVFHMMCKHETTCEEQMNVLSAINANRNSFYDQLVTWNDNAEGYKSPLPLFPDSRGRHNWPAVAMGFPADCIKIKALLEAGSTAQSATGDNAMRADTMRADTVYTPCFVLLISAYPTEDVLLDGTISVVLHPTAPGA